MPLAYAAACAVATLLPLVAAAGPAAAVETDTFRLTPSPLEVQGHERRTFAFDLAPGQSVGDAIRLTNRTDEPRRFRLYGADAVHDRASGATTVAPSTTEPVGVGRWVELDRTELTLAPRESTVVPFTVHRPRDSTAEGLGAVVAEEFVDVDGASGISVAYRLAVLIRLGGDVAGLRVGVPRLAVPVTPAPARAELSVELRNESLGPARATVVFTAEGLTGRVWPVGETEVRIEPGGVREVSATWDTVPRWGGAFRPAVAVSWDGGSIVRAGQRTVYPPLWLLAAAIVVLGVGGGRELRRSREGAAPAPAVEAR